MPRPWVGVIWVAPGAGEPLEMHLLATHPHATHHVVRHLFRRVPHVTHRSVTHRPVTHPRATHLHATHPPATHRLVRPLAVEHRRRRGRHLYRNRHALRHDWHRHASPHPGERLVVPLQQGPRALRIPAARLPSCAPSSLTSAFLLSCEVLS